MKGIRMQKNGSVISAFIIVTFILCAPIGYTAGPEGHKAPGFTILNLDGEKVSLDDYENNIVILTFWATWCVACHKQIPALKEIHQKYKDEGVVILAVSLDFGKTVRVKSIVEKENINYPILLGTLKLAERYGIRGIPATWIIGKDGQLYKR